MVDEIQRHTSSELTDKCGCTVGTVLGRHECQEQWKQGRGRTERPKHDELQWSLTDFDCTPLNLAQLRISLVGSDGIHLRTAPDSAGFRPGHEHFGRLVSRRTAQTVMLLDGGSVRPLPIGQLVKQNLNSRIRVKLCLVRSEHHSNIRPHSVGQCSNLFHDTVSGI